MRSEIVITSDFERFLEELKEGIDPANLHIFQRDEFKIDDAKEVIKEAYVATEEPKVLALFALRYNTYAQNALLKILEEPPKNVIFLLVAKAKSTFLPTILSRLPLRKIKSSETESLRIESFDLAKLYELVQEKEMSKAKAKEILKGMFHYAIEKKLPLNQKEIDYFAKALELIELNSNPANIFITAGLIILKHQKRRHANR